MIKLQKKTQFYKFGVFVVSIFSLMLMTNQAIIVKKHITEIEKTNSIIHNKKDNVYKNDYLAVLEISKINLRKGIVDIDSENNDVDKNIQIISTDISNIGTETIILAAHSGSGYKAFFKNLDKLVLEDIVSIYYDGLKYNYFVTDIYIEEKDGDIEIPESNNLLVLTTCYGKHEQLVIILEQKDYEKTS